ncbi:MAG: single-stranded-DNA-specific exonuclease RecJ [Lachnospiraceae bacterium]|nr:single-stranded-DNA-specific exonuclease RecJ [Lachnospiraceae bacterium]
MKNWILLRKSADYAGLSKELNIDPVAVRVMVNRGLTDIEDMKKFLSSDISESFSHKGLPNIDKAVSKIKEAKEKNLKTLIVGDYDADGVCASVILMKGLKLFGLDCDYIIPNRISDGYGINENIVTNAHTNGVGFIITCDNGISARDSIDLAVSLGMEVVVTDHHTVTKSEVPTKADIIVNPKLKGNEYPMEDICGAQVAFKVLSALFDNDPVFDTIKDEILEFAAIACVTDVMPLTWENRNLVKWALLRLKNALNPGLRKLVEKCELGAKERLVASDIGFRIGPCINASGRIEVADISVNLFLSRDESKREELADRLLSLNAERKELTEKCVNDGIAKIKELYSEDEIPDIIVLYLPECHVSICGLVAGRIKENYYHPAIVFTDSANGLTGSGRSIDEYNMIEGIQKCADILGKFGGHKAACGLSLSRENLPELIERLNNDSALTKEDLTEKLYIDADMPFGYVTENLINDLYKLEPFGTKNPTPVFALKDLQLIKGRRIGENHIFLTVKDKNGKLYELKLWRKADEFEEFLLREKGEGIIEELYDTNGTALLGENILLTVSYYPGINVYRDRRNIDFTVKDYKLS